MSLYLQRGGAWLFHRKNCDFKGCFGCFGQKLFRIAERPKEKLCLTSLPAKTPNATENPNKGGFRTFGAFWPFVRKRSWTQFFSAIWHSLLVSALSAVLLRNRHSLGGGDAQFQFKTLLIVNPDIIRHVLEEHTQSLFQCSIEPKQ